MRKIIILFLMFLYSFGLSAQSQSVNWLFFIDGKLPQPIQCKGEIILKDTSTCSIKSIPFEYKINHIQVQQCQIDSLLSTQSQIVTVKLYFREWRKKSHNTYVYTFDVPLRCVFEEYMIFDIVRRGKLFSIQYYTSSGVNLQTCQKNTPIFHQIEVAIQRKGCDHKIIELKKIDCKLFHIKKQQVTNNELIRNQ